MKILLIHLKIVIKIIWNQSKVVILSSIIVFNYEFVFDVQLLYYKCHKINRNHEGSYVDSPDWIKNKKATKSSINKKYNKCFQYALIVALNYEEKHAERITKIKTFVNKYKW